MTERTLVVEPATPLAVAEFGHWVGAHAQLPVYAQWPGVVVHGGLPLAIGADGEILHVRMAARRFPVQVELLERHPGHTQTYLSANGKPWVMVLGRGERDGLPDFGALRAFVFDGGAGIAMHAGTWHEFPLALQDDTRFVVVTRREANVDTLTVREHARDARGPDLERWDVAARARIVVQL